MMVNSVWVDPESKKNLALLNKGALLQEGEEPPATVEVGADAMAGMQQNSENNLAAFEMLKGKAEESLQRVRDNEVTEKHNHDLRVQALLDAIHLAEDKMEDAKRDHTRLGEEKAEAEGEVAKTEETKAAAEKYLSGVTSECDKASQDWAARQQGAKEEMAAIQKAKEILASRVTVFVQSRLHAKVGDPSKDAEDKQSAIKQAQKARQDVIAHFRALGAKMK